MNGLSVIETSKHTLQHDCKRLRWMFDDLRDCFPFFVRSRHPSFFRNRRYILHDRDRHLKTFTLKLNEMRSEQVIVAKFGVINQYG